MNRNTESHFSELPKVDIARSIFDRSSSHKTSFNVGELIPFFIDEILPGDTFKVTTSAVVRLQTLLTPIMDNMYMDTYYFFVPNRIVWSHWKEFMGENSISAWIPQTEYTIPHTIPPTITGWEVGTIADYFGIPVGVWNSNNLMSKFPSSLPFRGYCSIVNEWFRDQNLQDPVNFSVGDAHTAGGNGNNYITSLEKGGKPFHVARYHDYFSSCLPNAQKSEPVTLFGNHVGSEDSSVNQWLPVFARGQYISSPGNVPVGYRPVIPGIGLGNQAYLKASGSNPTSIVSDGNISADSSLYSVVPNNLYADFSGANITINDLRLAFQLQKFYEKSALAGTRYREILKEHFGVSSSDARMMIPEYLGGHRFPLSIHQVANQSQGETEFLGDLGAMSNTSDVHEDFVRSFEEHGYIIGVCCVRYDHSYPQGLERFWTRSDKLDFYWPVFANIGNQPVYKHEIYWKSGMVGNEVFGYQEAWADYRYKPSRVSGQLRPGVDGSLATWHLADYYEDTPSLSDQWLREDKSNVDRVLAVSSSVANQVFCDFYVKSIVTRAMPIYSIPGLIDHH